MNTKFRINLISISLSLISTLLIVFVFLLILNKNPFEIFSVIFTEVFASGYGIGQTLFKATPLIICGCGLAVCFHASLFNIGAEGQLNAGSFVIALVALKAGSLPFPILFILCIVCGFVVSGITGIIPAYIKIKKGVSEVITTIMLNFIILALVNYFLVDFFAVKATMHTEKIADSNMLMKFSDIFPFFEGSSLNMSFVIALLLAFASYIFIYKTKFGYKLRAAGFNETASRYIGININKVILLSFFTGAGITSLAGINYIFGYKGFYEMGFSSNVGFTAIAVALLARNNPLGIIFSSLLFAVLDYGGLSVNQLVPKEIMLVVQGIIILSILAVDRIVKSYFEKRGIA
ncbi:MAG: ABC transporter permease [Ignavibacteria bacterium]|nr:ABC transporter permease [Ignavibacteria bacterium]